MLAICVHKFTSNFAANFVHYMEEISFTEKLNPRNIIQIVNAVTRAHGFLLTHSHSHDTIK